MLTKVSFLRLSILILLILGLPPINFHFASWAAWIFLFRLYYLTRRSIEKIMAETALIGLSYFAIHLGWVASYSVTDYLLLVILSAPCFTVYFLIFHVLIKETDPFPIQIIGAGMLWLLILQLLDLSPLSSTLITACFYAPLPLLAAISFTGYQLFSSLILATSCAFSLAWIQKSFKPFLIGLSILLLLTGLAYWGNQTTRHKMSSSEHLKTALIQHHLPDSSEWLLQNNESIKHIYQQLATEASQQKVDLIVFPRYDTFESLENLLPFYLDLAGSLSTPIILARHIEIPSQPNEPITSYKNIALLLEKDGKNLDFYQTVRAPFFVPHEQTSPEAKLLSVKGKKAGVLLCTESIWPDIAKRSVEKGAELLISLSYPGLFNTPTLAYYQTIQNQLRAIESGRFVALVSSHGPSALIDPLGRILTKAPLNKEFILYADAGLLDGKTFYHRWGYLWGILACLFLLVLALSRLSKSSKTS